MHIAAPNTAFVRSLFARLLDGRRRKLTETLSAGHGMAAIEQPAAGWSLPLSFVLTPTTRLVLNRGSIVDFRGDVIVVPMNEMLAYDRFGASGAVLQAAGPELLAAVGKVRSIPLTETCRCMCRCSSAAACALQASSQLNICSFTSSSSPAAQCSCRRSHRVRSAAGAMGQPQSAAPQAVQCSHPQAGCLCGTLYMLWVPSTLSQRTLSRFWPAHTVLPWRWLTSTRPPALRFLPSAVECVAILPRRLPRWVGKAAGAAL